VIFKETKKLFLHLWHGKKYHNSRIRKNAQQIPTRYAASHTQKSQIAWCKEHTKIWENIPIDRRNQKRWSA
jgi:hypothetical protein